MRIVTLLNKAVERITGLGQKAYREAASRRHPGHLPSINSESEQPKINQEQNLRNTIIITETGENAKNRPAFHARLYVATIAK
jgi:hypothetical protein